MKYQVKKTEWNAVEEIEIGMVGEYETEGDAEMALMNEVQVRIAFGGFNLKSSEKSRVTKLSMRLSKPNSHKEVSYWIDGIE